MGLGSGPHAFPAGARGRGRRAGGFLHGVIDEVRQDLARWQAAGIGRVMLQLLDMEDLEVVRLIECELV